MRDAVSPSSTMALAAALALSCACGGDDGGEDADAGRDAAAPVDASPRDAETTTDASSVESDGGPLDAGSPDAAAACPAPIVPTRDRTATEYVDYYEPWPGVNARNADVFVDAGAYLALAFQPVAGQYGEIDWVESPRGSDNSVLVSIDRCPGVFRSDECQSGPIALLEGGGPRWTTGPFADQPGICELEVGETYYLNLFFGSADGVPFTGMDRWSTRMSNDWSGI